MKRVIVDYKKLTNEILAMLVEKYPDGYGDDDIIRFKNAKNETVEALEVYTEDTIYLVKVSTFLADSMENYEDDEDDDNLSEVDGINVDPFEIEHNEEEEEEEEEDDNEEEHDDDDDE